MHITAHLTFDGHCEAAFRTYAACLRGEITKMLRYAETAVAESTAHEMQEKIAHATLRIGEQKLTGADVPGDHYVRPAGFAVQLDLHDPDEAERVFGVLADGGTINVPLGKTFWAARYGLVTDRFGVPWEINC